MQPFAPASRSYPRNSPQAAGRLIALALISDGEINAAEWDVLCDTGALAQVGLAGHEWHDIVDGLCHDMLATAPAGAMCRIESETMARWFAEVDDPQLQRLVIEVSAALIAADGHVDDGESVVLRSALEHWVLPADAQAEFEPMLYGLDFEVQARPAPALNNA